MPSVFGVSGYSGAGTKSGEKDAEGRPKTVAKVVSVVSVQGIGELCLKSWGAPTIMMNRGSMMDCGKSN